MKKIIFLIILSFILASNKQYNDKLSLANKNHNENNYEIANSIYESIIESNYYNDTLFYNYACNSLKLFSKNKNNKYIKSAKDFFQKSSINKKNNPIFQSYTLYNEAISFHITNDDNNSLEKFKNSLLQNPNDSETIRNINILLKKQKDNQQDKNNEKDNQDSNNENDKIEEKKNYILETIKESENKTRKKINKKPIDNGENNNNDNNW